MSNVLLVGSSSGVLDLAHRIKKRGHKIIVLGGIKSDPCHSIADISIICDYGKIDDCISLCMNHEIHFVVPGSNDIAFDCALKISEELKLKTFDDAHTVKRLHNKSEFRKLLRELSIPQPTRYNLEDVDAPHFDDWPLIVKPELAFSGKGITVLKSRHQLGEAVINAQTESRNSTCTIESFVTGDLYSISSFVSSEELPLVFFANEFCESNPYAVSSSYSPSDLPAATQEKVTASLLRLVQALRLKDGLLHVQFIYNAHTGDYYFIECMRRMIGDYYGKKISHAYSLDYYDLYLRPYLGEKIPGTNMNNNPKRVYRRIISDNKSFMFTEVTMRSDERLIEFVPLVRSGEVIEAFPNGKAGIMFYETEKRGDND